MEGHKVKKSDGIIPAYAGSTDRGREVGPVQGDHPRIRGEHDLTDEDRESFAGSSPHTRGAPVPAQTGRKASGIIPAYAGSTERPRSREAIAWDHPRIRGEHLKEITIERWNQGSSPHTRGAPKKRD